MNRVGIVGLGYVGISSAVCFAEKSEVVCVDVDGKKIRSLASGTPVIGEEGVGKLLASGLRRKRLTFTTGYEALSGCAIIFLTVGTPSLETGSIDLRHVESASEALGPVLKGSPRYVVVAVKSTVTPGTTRQLVAGKLEGASGGRLGVDFGVSANPEFLREGSAVKDTLNPDRIVVGSDCARTARLMRRFYRTMYARRVPPMVETDLDTAELVKYACNSFLAAKISYINLIARICQVTKGSDVDTVASAMGLDPRIGRSFLEAGPGYGGSCFPKDVRAMIAYAQGLGVDASLLDAVDRLNETQPAQVVSIAQKGLGSLEGKEVGILGAAFKAGTDDVRESRGVRVAQLMVDAGAKVRIYDPKALEAARQVLGPGVRYCESVAECLHGTDLAVVTNAEAEFRKLTPADFSRLMAHPRVLDTRRVYDPGSFEGRVPVLYLGRGSRRP